MFPGTFLYGGIRHAQMDGWMHVSACTQPGVQKQPSNTLWVAVFLILEDLAGYNLQLHLEQRNNGLYRKLSDGTIG